MMHIRIPVSELTILMINPEMARISPDNKHVAVIIENDLHILVEGFEAIESSESLEEIIKRNFP